ncbi:PHD finger protein rhinoceros isoform X2 [Amblyomma americanum]
MSSDAKQKRSSIDAGSGLTGATLGSKRFRKTSACEDEDSRLSSSKSILPPLPVPPMSKIYNSSYRSNKPAELFRKDLISAMKLPDSEPLESDDYWPISDGWKQEWERGVQVPVNPGHLPEPAVKAIKKKSKSNDFKLPLNKFLRLSHDEFFSNDLHVLTNVSTLAEKTCRYDLDSLDQNWLRVFNEERKSHGLEPLLELTMEMILEDFETQCFEKLQREIRTEQGLGIEYDEDVVCDVCRSPDSEEGNEMVFCDQCDLCVHQACYGIQRIPEGSWVCRTCALGIRPPCVLCPARGGAMKSTRSGQKWAHVSCALWVPEVSIGCVEKMEPITKISQIPPSRWALTCCLCRERMGACIQCSVKACKRAYHVTCAFENSLEMKAVFDDNPDDEVKLKSYCPKHSKKKEVHRKEASSDDSDKKASPTSREGHHQREMEITSEEKESARLAKIQAIEAEFYKHVSLKETAEAVSADPVVVDFVFNYWKLKRKANHDKPLLAPLKEETDRLDKLEENSLYSRVKMFVHLRQDLERVRNLCYMVSRREKIARSFLKIKEDIFEHQVAMLKPGGPRMNEREREAIVLAGQSEHIYDRLVSHDPSGPKPCLRLLLDALEGREVANLYGLIKKPPSTPTRLPNPYAKQYVNGLRSRRLSIMGGAGEPEGCVAQDEDSRSTADSATAAVGRVDTTADQATVELVQSAGAALETLCEEWPEKSEEQCGQPDITDLCKDKSAEEQPRVSRSQKLESADDASRGLPKSEPKKEDHSDTESRMPTRSRTADAIKCVPKEEAKTEHDEAECKTQTRSRRLESDESVRNASRTEAKKDEVGDPGNRTPSRTRRTEVDELVKGLPSIEKKDEVADAGNRTPTRSRRLEMGDSVLKASPKGDLKEDELGGAGIKTPARSRKCEVSDDGVHNLPQGKMQQDEPTELDCKVSYRSRRHERKAEIEELPMCVLRSETKKEGSVDIRSRSSSRNRKCDIKVEPAKEVLKACRADAQVDAIQELASSKPVNRGRRLGVKNDLADDRKSTLKYEAKKGECSERDSRVSSRNRRVEAVAEGSDNIGKGVSKKAKKDDFLEQENRNSSRTTRHSEGKGELAAKAMKEVSKNQTATDEIDVEVASRGRRLRKRSAPSYEENLEMLQPCTLAAICEFPEEPSDVGRCTRSSTAQKLEDSPEEAGSREPAESRQDVVSAGESYGKHALSDENVPKKPDRRERRDSLTCSVLLPEALSPARASSLSGYRIPKKAKAPNGVLEDRRGSSPVSPLHEVRSLCYAGSDGYTRGRSHANLRRPVLTPHCEGRGDAYVERWKRDLDFGGATGNSAEWAAGKLEVKENGSRYSMRYRPKCGKDS